MRTLSGMSFNFNKTLCVDCIVLPYGIIDILQCCTGMVFVSGTSEVMRWSLDLVLEMPLPWGCCVE